MTEQFKCWVTRFIAWLDRKNFVSVHAAMLYVTMYQTMLVTVEAWKYAYMSHFNNGTEVALVIAAVTAPFATLQGFVFKIYSESRKDK